MVSDIMYNRAEQSEVLTEDVQSAEKHVELLKQTCGTMSTKINSVLSSKAKSLKILRLNKYLNNIYYVKPIKLLESHVHI